MNKVSISDELEQTEAPQVENHWSRVISWCCSAGEGKFSKSPCVAKCSMLKGQIWKSIIKYVPSRPPCGSWASHWRSLNWICLKTSCKIIFLLFFFFFWFFVHYKHIRLKCTDEKKMLVIGFSFCATSPAPSSKHVHACISEFIKISMHNFHFQQEAFIPSD